MTSAVDQADFRRALGSFATGVAVVSCVVDGVDHAMTANAIASLSLTPPLVMVAIAVTSRFHGAVRTQDHWCVSILDSSAADHAAWLATKGRPLDGQLARVPHHRSHRGIAVLDQSLAWLECRTDQGVRAGDHDMFIGEVERIVVSDPGDALLYWRSEYRSLPG